MWKVVVRGIRETLERRVCRTNVYSQSSQDNKNNEVKTSLACQEKFLPPVLITYNGFCGSAKNAGAKDKRHGYDWNTRHSWSEAVGWSSVLAAGWVVCQTLCLHKRVLLDSNENLRNKLHGHFGVSFILIQLLNVQPKKILPITNCAGTSNEKSNLQDSDSQQAAKKQFGPITINEAFKKAADNFTNTHKVVIGEYELRYGIQALEEKRYKDALTHFSEGAKLSSPGSMFNLGLCYEKGIGTLADLTKAAKCYNDAAAHDHADALYNLGVFHAQGKGGLSVDIDIARKCFIKAARLGQVQAQHALDLEKAHIQSQKNIPSAMKLNPNFEKNEKSDTSVKLSDLILYSNFGGTFNVIPKCSQVLEFLGLKEPSSAPMMITASECRVPY
ncbi:hypothetical protein PUN28_010287 [Cardiocondyla obscurior]|uniref:Uncharacterized protein n=1 Tax=Cardiocondyla obscurior TaxID=286306 RepID=A0AAW2FQC4_9HYME